MRTTVCKVALLTFRTKALCSTEFRRNAYYSREQTVRHSVRTSKVVKKLPSEEAQDIIWQSHMSVKFAECLGLEVIYTVCCTVSIVVTLLQYNKARWGSYLQSYD